MGRPTKPPANDGEAAAFLLSQIRFEPAELQMAVRKPGWCRPPSIFGDYHFWWVEHGSGELSIQGRPVRLRGGELLLLKPGDRVTARVLGKTPARVYFLPFLPLEEPLWSTLEFPANGCPCPAEWPSLIREGHARLAQLTRLGRPTHLARRAVFYRLLESLLEHGLLRPRPAAARSAPQKKLDAITKFLSGSLERSISLNEISQRSGLDPSTINRLFRRFLKCTPAHWRTTQRLEKARVLLASGEPVGEVSLKVGFGSASGFSRAFKARYGLSPENWSLEIRERKGLREA